MSTTSPAELASSGANRHPRRWPRRAGIVAALFVALLAGVGIGSAANSQTAALNTANRNFATQSSANLRLRGQVSTLKTEYSAEKAQASQATSIAQDKAAAAYALRNAALNQRAKSLTRREQAVAAAEGQLQSSQISGSGVYVVGRDIKAGIWHTKGDGGQTDNECYFATLNSTNTSDIADNNNFDGAETVDLSGVYAFEISGPCTWVRVG